MNLKKIMSGAAAFMMTASLMTSYPTGCFKGLVAPVSVGAEELNFCGKTENDKVYWSFDSATGTLTISGSGEMEDYSFDYQAPWGITSNMVTVFISDNVTRIGDYAFQGLNGLKLVNIPSNTKLGLGVFNNSLNINEVKFTSYNKNFDENISSIKSRIRSKNIINYTYTGSCGPNATFTLDSDGNLEISGSGDISSNAFQDWTNITKVVIGDEITTIGRQAFYSCTNLKNITIGKKVTTIAQEAFRFCRSLESVILPNSVFSTNGTIFYNCDNLTSIEASCKLKIALSTYKDKVTYAHPNINEKCECNDCHETFHVDTDKNCICDKCNTSIDHDTTANPNKCAVCGTEFVYITANGEKTRYTFGDSVTITAPTAETGMTFDCWLNSQNVAVSNESPYTFTATVNDTFTPKYKSAKAETMTVVWVSAYGQEMGRKEIDSSQFNIETLKTAVAIPSKLGCINGRWVLKSDSVTGFTKDVEMTFVPEYDEEEKYYTITVNDGTPVTARYKATEIATITANAPQNGMKFSHWESNGKAVCYSETYKFYVSTDMTLTAIYVEDEKTVEKMGAADIVNSYYNADTKKSTVVAQLTVPDGCKMVFAGLVATTKKSVADSGLTVENASYKKGGENLSYKSYRYTWTIGNSKGVTLYSRAYLVYTTPDNETKIIYSDNVDVCKP